MEFERGAAAEDSQAPEEPLLGRREQVVAPADGSFEGLLTGREITRAAGEEPQAVVEAGEQGGRGEELAARGGQLEGERQAVEAHTDRGHGGGVIGRQREGGVGGAGPLREEGHGFGLGQLVPRRQRLQPGQPQRRHGELLLLVQAQHRAAGDQQLEPRGLEQAGDGGGGVNHLLEAVQEEQDLLPGQVVAQPIGQSTARRLVQAQRLGDRGEHERGVAHGGEGDEDDAVGEGVAQGAGDFDGQAGLADAAGAGAGDERDLGTAQQRLQRGDFVGPADQGLMGERQVRRRGR